MRAAQGWRRREQRNWCARRCRCARTRVPCSRACGAVQADLVGRARATDAERIADGKRRREEELREKRDEGAGRVRARKGARSDDAHCPVPFINLRVTYVRFSFTSDDNVGIF